MLFQENCVRSQNEQALYTAGKNSVEENKSLNILIKTLHEQMQVMRYETENLKTKKTFRRKSKSPQAPNMLRAKKN
jgi:hypothetical protein